MKKVIEESLSFWEALGVIAVGLVIIAFIATVLTALLAWADENDLFGIMVILVIILFALGLAAAVTWL
jgi:hypothetical protein